MLRAWRIGRIPRTDIRRLARRAYGAVVIRAGLGCRELPAPPTVSDTDPVEALDRSADVRIRSPHATPVLLHCAPETQLGRAALASALAG